MDSTLAGPKLAPSGTRRGRGGARKWSSGLLTTANANMGNLAEEGGAWGSGPRMELLTPPEPFYRRLRPWSAPRSALPYSPPFHTREGTVGERGGAEGSSGGREEKAPESEADKEERTLLAQARSIDQASQERVAVATERGGVLSRAWTRLAGRERASTASTSSYTRGMPKTLHELLDRTLECTACGFSCAGRAAHVETFQAPDGEPGTSLVSCRRCGAVIFSG